MEKKKMTYEEFMKKFNYEKLKDLTMDEYDQFCRNILYKIHDGGEIKSLPITNCWFWKPDGKKISDHSVITDEKGVYAWKSKLGPNKDSAFKRVKEIVLSIVDNAKSGNYEAIDDIYLAETFKWKIAYFYSGRKLIDWFKKDNLVKFANTLSGNDNGFNKKSKTSEIQKFLMEIRKTKYNDDNNKFDQECLFPIDRGSYITSKTQESSSLTTLLKNVKNLILHGAPGTGKTYLARKIAEEMGCSDNEIGFVQFHPSYDYTDFVEGIRPTNSEDNTVNSFKKQDGIFKKFCEKALCKTFDYIYQNFLNSVNGETFETPGQNKPFKVTVDGENINAVPESSGNSIKIYKKELLSFFAPDIEISENSQHSPYIKALWKILEDKYKDEKFVFIIDEINRGELSKIFGELFFAIEPSYRGAKNCDNLRTQYANLQETPNLFDSALGKKEDFGHFFVPENVYIIGTMNDIDRSVESMDLAMRRRFTFKEISANESMAMLTSENLKNIDSNIIEHLKNRMTNLNNKIIDPEIGLSNDYQIGAAYFLKFADYYSIENDQEKAFENLWKYNLEPLLREYLRGQGDITEKLKQLENAYKNYTKSEE